MPLTERAAQFAAFRALTGFEEEIEEEGRHTDAELELDESRKESLDRRLHALLENGEEEAEFIWFVPDGKKTGGSYRRQRDHLRKIDVAGQMIWLSDGERIPMERLYDIRSDTFPAD